MTAVSPARMWASQADRDRIVAILQQSFAEGRLTRPELGQRVGQALVAGEFPELVALIGDLPAGPFDRLPAHRATPRPPVPGWRPAGWLARLRPWRRARR